jgi:hypothetical protein
MKIKTIAKLLDILSYLGIVAIFAVYLFVKPKAQYITLALLGVCFLKMIGAMIKANFLEKENAKLKEENDFLTSKIKENN